MRRGAIGLAAALLALQTAGALGQPAGSVRPARTALILYDGTSIRHREGGIGAAHIANLLGHFGFRGAQKPVERYVSGEMARYDAVFMVAGAEEAPLSSAFLRDARATTRTFVWIGYQLGRLLTFEEGARRGLRVEGYLRDSKFRHVRYKDTTLGKGTGDLARIVVVDAGRVRVEAVATDGEGGELPYIVHAGNLWAVADTPFAYVDEQDRYLAFCDAMHEMLGVVHPTDRRALIRLEDVTPEDDPALVKRAVDVFASEGVPFQLGLVPFFRDPSGNTEVSLSDRPALVAAVRDAVKRGGTIVLHGSTHQYRGVTADDFEFWDAETNRPRPDDSVEMVHNKLVTAVDECFRNDLYPVAWETPHYTASMLDYEQFARVFSTLYERPLTIDLQGTQQFFPYPTVDARGSLIVPENLGFLPVEKPDPALLVSNARALLVVRDGVASAFVHDFLDPARFRELIRGVKGLGYRFVSIKDFPCRVATGGRLVMTRGARGSLTLQQEYLHQFLLAPDGRRREDTFSAVRRSGEVIPALTPAAGEILVASRSMEPPPSRPSFGGRLRTLAASAWAQIRRHGPLPPAPPRPLAVALVWNPALKGEDGNDQESFRSAFAAYGVPARLLPAEALSRAALSTREILIVPGPSARSLSAAGVESIARFARQGGGVITDGRSPLAEALGVVYGGRTSIGSVRDRAAPEALMHWRPLVTLDAFRLPVPAVPLATDAGSVTPAAASFAVGAGKVLYLAAPLDPYTPDGTSRYPFLFEHALETFGREVLARRSAIELYFDPALRQGVSIEQLGPMWRRLGVRVIYAAAWEFDSNYTYDYERLLRVCHANGLLVYAWFEFPQVSRIFWERHPEWREVPAAGKSLPSWRRAMNLANPACRAAALQFLHDVLARWPWDGVNLAELNFDGQADGDAPEQFVPMNDDVRARFRDAEGFDPRELFLPASRHWWKRDPRGWTAWLRFRQELVTEWHRAFLSALRPVMDGGREVIVTVLESLEHPKVTADTGVDTAEIAGLTRDFDFTIQVEDPAVSWAESPRRYERLARRYRTLLPPGRRFLFDINVIADRRVEATHLPLALASGTELAATVKAARAAGGRVALYGDSTVRARDLELIASAFAGAARIASDGLTWTIDTPEAIEVAAPAGAHDFYLEGGEWPYGRPGWVLIPPGHHLLSAYRPWFRIFDLSALRPQVLQINGSLESAEVERGRLRFEYASEGRALAVLGRKPQRVFVDDVAIATAAPQRDPATVLVLPKGRHQVDVAGSSPGALVLDLMSIVSSSLIVAFGVVACLMLATLYVGIRIRRLVRPRGARYEKS